MCGIAGYSGRKNACEEIIRILKRLEHRGYDSAGIALGGNRLTLVKSVGKIEQLERRISPDMKARTGIGHTRWATHGRISEENAHPHTDCHTSIAVVHNGIIENYRTLKKRLSGHTFKSETDTEIIPHLIEEFINAGDSPEFAFQRAVEMLDGSFAVAAICRLEPDRIYFAQKNCTLVCGIGEHGVFISSDPAGLPSEITEMFIIDDGQRGFADKNSFSLFDRASHKISPHLVKKPFSSSGAVSYSGHYMLKEICEQPDAVIAAASDKISFHCRTVSFAGIPKTTAQSLRRIVMFGCGSSYYAGMVGRQLIESIAGIPARVEYASEFRYCSPVVEPNTLFVALTQSGETRDTLAALELISHKALATVCLTNVPGSTVTRKTDISIFLNAGPERSVAATKSFTCQIVVLYLLALYLGYIRQFISLQDIQKSLDYVYILADRIREICQSTAIIEQMAARYACVQNTFFLGRGLNYPVALEGALKLKEVGYIHAEGLPAAEMKHGPIALIDEDMPVFFIAPTDATYPKILGNIQEVRSRKGNPIIITSHGNREILEIADNIIWLPESPCPQLMPALSVIPLQLMAYFVAIKKGLSVDKPRNLAKTVTVE
jgi:glucosamine--fructose-6-phosphate aminotransferase (isomerizing)